MISKIIPIVIIQGFNQNYSKSEVLRVVEKIDLEREKSVKEVVDGQQRSRAIIDYCDGQFAARIEGGTRKRFGELTMDQRERLLITPLPVGYLLGATDSDVIDIFARINSISKTLNAQEKRNAKFGGEFKFRIRNRVFFDGFRKRHGVL